MDLGRRGSENGASSLRHLWPSRCRALGDSREHRLVPVPVAAAPVCRVPAAFSAPGIRPAVLSTILRPRAAWGDGAGWPRRGGWHRAASPAWLGPPAESPSPPRVHLLSPSTSWAQVPLIGVWGPPNLGPGFHNFWSRDDNRALFSVSVSAQGAQGRLGRVKMRFLRNAEIPAGG